MGTASSRRQRGGLGVDVSGALNLVGSLMTPLGLAYLLPAALAVGYGEAVWPFLVAGAITSGFGLGLQRVTSGKEGVGAREGFLVVSLVWVLVAVGGAIPYVLAEPQLSRPVDALFESMSGFATSGATVATHIDAMPNSMLMWRALTSWLGGLGIIVLFLAVLPRMNVAGRQALFKTEAAGPEIGLESTIREAARRFVGLYVAITGLEVLTLSVLGWTGIDERMDFFRAVAHSFATLGTTGFSTEERNLEAFAPATQWAVLVFMVISGTNYALLFTGIVLRRGSAFRRDEEFRVYLVLLVLATAVVALELIDKDLYAGEEVVRQAAFNTVSMMTTTGFASADFNAWTSVTNLVLVGAILISASAGSTSGSIKLVRHVLIAKMLTREIRHTVHPELVAPLRLNGAVVDERTLRAIIVFVFLFIGTLFAGAAVILLDSSLRGIELSAFDSIADSATALGGAGPGLGFAGPMGSFEPFGDLSTLVLSAEMYLGRLEIIPVLVLLAGSYWRA